jgi:hypothetical protein
MATKGRGAAANVLDIAADDDADEEVLEGTLVCALTEEHKQRQSDPGSALWQRVALPLQAVRGLTSGGATFSLGSGAPIPESWDPTRKGVKY